MVALEDTSTGKVLAFQEWGPECHPKVQGEGSLVWWHELVIPD